MIVDDEEQLTRLVRMVLGQTGRYEVREVNVSTKAVSIAKEFRPDVILLDVVMPGADGGEVACSLKAHNETKDIPFVFVTSTISRADTNNLPYRSGGHLFLCKPVSGPVLMKVIDDLIAGRDPAGG